MQGATAFSSIRLVCPRCRRRDEHGRLQVSRLRDGASGQEAVLGELAGSPWLECPRCQASYPVICGVPVVFSSPDACALEQAAWFGPSAPSAASLGAAIAGRDPASPLCQDVARVGRWLRAGFGDWAGDNSSPHPREVIEWLRTLGHRMEGPTVSFGCAVGREAWECPAPVVLVDAHLPSLLAARTLELEGRLRAHLPAGGHRWQAFEVVAPCPPRAPVALLCADVLDPPFEARSFDTVLALNLIDSVSNPWLALQQLAAATSERGALVISSPFAWRAEVTPRERWLSSVLPMPDQQALVSLSAELGLRAAEQCEMSWSLWGSDRESVQYRSACLVFRR